MSLAQRLQQPDVAELPDWKAAEVLNLPDPELPYVWKAVPCGLIRAYLLSSGDTWARLKRARSDESLSETHRKIADTVYDAIDLQAQIDLSNSAYRSAVQSSLSALVTAGVLSQTHVDNMLLLGQRHTSWAEANNIVVDARAVGLARGGR